MAKRKNKSPIEAPRLDPLSQIHTNAAGLDIGAAEIYACVPADRDAQPVQAFGTFTVDLHALVDWLKACRIDTVAMESTGVYWIPIYEILESRGFEVYLVNARHLKNVPGKKTDVLDCQWIQQLHTYGLLQASFRPPEQICALRALVRQRETLVRYRSDHIQHMHKALQQMNIQLHQVLSDITGVTGMSIIRAIAAGERDPKVLAQMRHPQCAHSEAEIAAALEGNYRPEHLFVLKQALAQYDFYGAQIRECDAELEALYAALAAEEQERELPARASKRRGKPRKNQAHFDLTTALYRTVGVDLTAIDGIDALTAQIVISEIGLDMTKWPTVKHFTSWLGLAPHTKKTGGKVISTRTKKTHNRANTALRVAAQSLWCSHSALGGFYRRIQSKYGASVAIAATAHKLARIIYRLLRYREAYVDPGETYYEHQYRERAVRNLKRKAASLGFVLLTADSQPGVVS